MHDLQMKLPLHAELGNIIYGWDLGAALFGVVVLLAYLFAIMLLGCIFCCCLQTCWRVKLQKIKLYLADKIS